MESLSTQLIHSGEPQPKISGAVSMPIFQSANYVARDEKNYMDVIYARLNNTPNHTALHEKLAAIENAETALVMASGMAAISTTLLSLLSAGDHMLAQRTLYGGTFSFVTQELKRFGIGVDFIDPTQPDQWKAKLRSNTKLIYVEAISNPLMEVFNLREVVDFAKKNSLLSLIDNTFPSPALFKPVPFGFDLSLHSATKYLNGHSDIIAGAVAGRRTLVDKIAHTLVHLGATLDPHACFLLHRGMKTLKVRMQAQMENAQKIAEYLSAHPAIEKVHYPGLKTNPGYAYAKEQFKGFGAMLSFELKGGLTAAEKFLKTVELPVHAASLGGVESLVILPARSSHAGMSPEERKAVGIGEALVRYSVGIEDADDLIRDLEQALK